MEVHSNKHPKGIWFVSILYMFEYFSFYGMRAIFVLYLINQLKFTDHYSYAIYGAFTALAYLAPLLGGVIADKILGFRNALILGGLLMTCGHFILGLDPNDLFFVALAFIICGFGYFESNIACLVNQLYPEDHPKRDSGFILLYLGGNAGGTLAPIICGYVAYMFGYEYGFSIAGVGMLIGILIFIAGSKHIPNVIPNYSENHIKRLLKGLFIALISFCIIAVAVLVIQNEYETYLVSSVSIIATIAFIALIVKNKQYRSKLLFAIPFIIFALLFWVFDDMIFTSFEVFIDRNISSQIAGFTIPASVLICINPLTIIILGVIISIAWQKNKPAQNYKQMMRFSFGFILQFLSFSLLAFSAYLATATGKSSIIWVAISISLLGAAELFINPIALSNITKAGGAKYAGFMAALYTLYTSSIAELSSAKLAQLSAEQDISKAHDLTTQAKLFFSLFGSIAIALLAIIIIWLGITICYKVLLQKREI
ncbi:MFS transporter [Francisella sp. Scap27]|uniref:peptide MFS transporter n=1 Tax=Francisella sp. Scap27 TaxID=2589986 RepID=UPI0015BE3996|nr:oligopeptide:H+ symporter [Francisella sp. Scap27]QLE78562.1 MFS transporter [Francisella sp. Scap27]